MIESGSMLFQGRRCGLLTLKINGSVASFETQPMRIADDAVFDAHYKLDECRASRSPVEAEIAFLNHWLQLTETPQVTLEVESPLVFDPPIKDDNTLGSATGASNNVVEISKVEFSTIDDSVFDDSKRDPA